MFFRGLAFIRQSKNLVHYLRLTEVHIGLTHGNIRINGHGVQVFVKGQHIAKGIESQAAAYTQG